MAAVSPSAEGDSQNSAYSFGFGFFLFILAMDFGVSRTLFIEGHHDRKRTAADSTILHELLPEVVRFDGNREKRSAIRALYVYIIGNVHSDCPPLIR